MTGKDSPAARLLQYWTVEPFAPLEGGARSCGQQSPCARVWQSCTVMQCIVASVHASSLMLGCTAQRCSPSDCALKHRVQSVSLPQTTAGPFGDDGTADKQL